jgi:hypothetical protein
VNRSESSSSLIWHRSSQARAAEDREARPIRGTRVHE